MSLSFTSPNKTIFIYDSTKTSEVALLQHVKDQTSKLTEVPINITSVTPQLLNSILTRMEPGTSSLLINKTSPWYRCFCEDFSEMNDFILKKTFVKFPSLIQTPIVIHQDEVYVNPSMKHIFDIYEEIYV
ncbi:MULTISPECIES: arsenate reductase family protein [Flammeovirga]|uniref:Arsenate reductase n=1 Tax=Flammeovirga agarivorans TaxID=2726742 RepID=A0A7X8SJ17_9BACT|nr:MULTISPECIES: hypothetical protein [Flammeovirga]NLR91140.1 hypothetical protein [Flammeovirga agarivorans]